MTAVGLHPFHSPSGVMLDESHPAFSACIQCATCDGFPCLVHAKSDADVVAVRPALEYGNVTLIRNAYVRRLRTDPTGSTVTSVIAEVDSMEHQFGADVVVLSAGAVNSAKILLASANEPHPNGLANGSDQVGRNYVFHNSRAFLAISREKNDTRFQKTLGLNDYYFGDADFDYPMGNLQMVGKSSAPMYRGEKPIETQLAPTSALRDVAEHAVDFWLSAEDLPDPDNRVTLDRGGNVVLAYTPNNTEPSRKRLHLTRRSASRMASTTSVSSSRWGGLRLVWRWAAGQCPSSRRYTWVAQSSVPRRHWPGSKRADGSDPLTINEASVLRRAHPVRRSPMTTEDSAMVDALADAVAGTVMLVMGGTHTGFFGVVKQKITTAIGVTVDSGPAKPLINEVTWHFRTLSTPAATKIGMIDRSWEEEKLTEAGNRLLSATLPKLDSLPADQRTQVNEWLISVAQRVAEAPYGENDEVSAGELAAIEQLRELLS
jgi:choline dehydrogenase-like flavoprotein